VIAPPEAHVGRDGGDGGLVLVFRPFRQVKHEGSYFRCGQP
jgi:hypothetical protein